VRRLTWWLRLLAIAGVVAAAGAALGAWLLSSAAYGLYLAAGILCILGAGPWLTEPGGNPAVMPDAVREEMRQRHRSRGSELLPTLTYFGLAVVLVGVGTLIEIYG
jgi:hypothetical protein